MEENIYFILLNNNWRLNSTFLCLDWSSRSPELNAITDAIKVRRVQTAWPGTILTIPDVTRYGNFVPMCRCCGCLVRHRDGGQGPGLPKEIKDNPELNRMRPALPGVIISLVCVIN